jgi:hypothetical protein
MAVRLLSPAIITHYTFGENIQRQEKGNTSCSNDDIIAVAQEAHVQRT